MSNQYDITADQIARHQSLMDALTAQATQPQKGQMVGGVYVAPGLLSALSGPLAVMANNYSQQQTDKQSMANSQARQTAMTQELQNLLGGGQQQISTPASPSQPVSAPTPNPQGTSSYAAGSSTPIDTTGGGSPLLNAMAPNTASSTPSGTTPSQGQPQSLNGTAAQLMASQFPENQALGQKLLAAQLGRKPETFSPQTVIGTDGKPLQILQGNYGTQRPSNYNPATDMKLSSGGQAYNPLTLQPGDMLPIRPQSNQQITVNPTVMQGTEERQFSKTLGEKDAARVDAAQTTLQTQAEMGDIINRFKQFESLPVLRGPTADWGVKAAQFGQIFGIPVPEGVSNAEQFQQLAKSYVTSLVQQGGRGFTDEDAKNAMASLVGLGNTQEGAVKMRQTLEDANNRAVRRAQQTLQIMSQRYPEVKDMSQLQKPPLAAPNTPIPSIQDEGGYNALPSGATYIGPDGQTRRKQ